MHTYYRHFLIRDWQPGDRQTAANVIFTVLQEYGLGCEPSGDGADWDVLKIEDAYWATGGEFWVVEADGQIVGTAGFYPVQRTPNSAEIRKMYLLPSVRGQGLGRFLLQSLEQAIAAKGYEQAWLETASVLKEAVQLYENSGYQATSGVETKRCDRIYFKPLSPVLSPLINSI